MAALEFKRTAGLLGSAGDSFVRIYEESFPASERDDTDSVLAKIADGRRRCYTAELERELVGLAVLLHLTIPGVEYLEYFAVDSRRRSQGIGGRFLAHVVADLGAADDAAAGMVFEVEPPEDAAGEESTIRRRRIDFYSRNGSSLVDCAPAYRVPDLAGAGQLRFLLMWQPLAGPTRLEGELLARCVRSILTESYELDGDDPIIGLDIAALTC